MRPRLAQLHQSGATDGQVPVWDDAAGLWVPGAGSGGGGTTTTTVGGTATIAEQAPDDAAIWFPANAADFTVSASSADRQLVLSPSEAYETDNGVSAVQECSVWEQGGTFHMLYTGGWIDTSLCYATADHPLGPWTKHGRVIGQGVGGESASAKTSFHFIDDDGQHYTYYAHCYTGSGTFDLFVATGDPADGALTKVGTALTHTVSAVAIQNNCVVNDNGTYRMIFESRDGSLWKLGYATASDPLGPFTVQQYPLTDLQISAGSWSGPHLRPNLAGNGWVLIYHGSTSGGLPTDIYRATSTDLLSWTKDASALVTRVVDPPEHDQVADPHYLVSDAGAFLFWSGANNVGGSESSSFMASQVPIGDPQWFDGSTWQTEWPSSAPTSAGDLSTAYMPLTTVVGGVPELVWDADDQLIPTEVPL